MIGDLWARYSKLQDELHLLRHQIENMHRPGTVTDVDYSDPKKPRARIQIGTDANGNPVKGPWLPIASFAGKRRIHNPVVAGQQMMQIAPDGTHENGFLVPYSFSESTQSPSTDPNVHVDVLGNLNETRTENGLTWSIGGTTFAFSKEGLAVTNGKITHNGANIGATHVHSKVTKGGDDSGPPEDY